MGLPRTSFLQHVSMGVSVVAGIALFAFAVIDFKHDQEARTQVSRVVPPKVPAVEDPQSALQGHDLEIVQKLKLMFNTGNYKGALDLIHAHLNDSTTSLALRDWLSVQRPVVLTSLAWLELQKKNCAAAVPLFLSALDVQKSYENYKGLGVCFLLQKNFPSAEAMLRQAVEKSPTDLEARILLSDVLESLGDLNTAVQVMEEGLTSDDPTNENLKTAKDRLETLRARAKVGQDQRLERQGHFSVTYLSPQHDALVNFVFETLEASLFEYTSYLGLTPSEGVFEVALYAPADFKTVAPGSPEWSEGVFDGRIRVPVQKEINDAVMFNLKIVLRHELSHALLHQVVNGRSIPAWFDEGLAQYLSCMGLSCEASGRGVKPVSKIDRTVLIDSFVALPRIDAVTAYRQSRFIVTEGMQNRGQYGSSKWSDLVPREGRLDSDFWATILGFSDFNKLLDEMDGRWKQALR